MIILKTVIFLLIAIWGGFLIGKVLGRVFSALFGSGKTKPTNVRNVSTLASDGDGDATLVEEIIQTSGPIKPGHLRQAVRDVRLLPKKKPDLNQWPRPPKPVYFTEAEADRLFSKTMRTKNRDVHNLATDIDQLQRYGLPLWQKEEDVADALGISLKGLHHYACHRIRETCLHYVTFAVRKRNGSPRIIYAPKRKLKALQRKVHDLLVCRLPISDHAHGFVTGRSVATNAAPHVGKKVVIKFDIQDCFPTIHFGRVRGLLIALGYSYPVAQSLAVLMTEAKRQPVKIDDTIFYVPVGERVCVQGAPTSPGLCNAIMKRLDQRLAKFARKMEFDYTRYADDLTFSGNNLGRLAQIKKVVAEIVEAEGFSLNNEKTWVMRAGGRQSVTGVVVNEVAGLSRKERRLMRAAAHQFNRKTREEQLQLRGKLAYLRMLNSDQADALARRLPENG